MSLLSNETPADFFRTLPTKVLLKLAAGEVDAVALAVDELVSRGRGPGGNWLGHTAAAEAWSQYHDHAAAMADRGGEG